MPSYLHPGVYVEEIPSGSKPIEGASTSIAAFLGYGTKGPIGEPELIHKWDDYVDTFGGVSSESDAMGLAVSAFYLNGGRDAYIARLTSNAKAASLPAGKILGKAGGAAAAINVLNISASSAGDWGEEIYVKATNKDAQHFKLEVGYVEDGAFSAEEVFDDLNMNEKDSSYVLTVINSSSKLVKVELASELKSNPDTYYKNGASVSGDLAGITWTEVKKDMTLALNIDGLGVKTITLGEPAGGSYSTSTKVKDEITKQVNALGAQSAYSSFACTFAGSKLTLTSGSKGSSSSVMIFPGELATLLKLGTVAGGAETHGTEDVVPKTMASHEALTDGDDGAKPGKSDYQECFAKLVKVRDISIILLPGESMSKDGTGNDIISEAVSHCEATKSRMVIVDPPQGYELDQAKTVTEINFTSSTYGVVYYPWVKISNPLYHPDLNATAAKTLTIAPSSFAAGMWSKIDGKRGVWKAPAGMGTGLLGVSGLEYIVENGEQDQLNPYGINCLRKMPGAGPVVWGARTRATKAVPEWRYVPVRRTAIMIEQSIYDGIQWAVFEPNDHRLWSALRANIGNFLNGLFRAGAFQGEKASDAYFVRCGKGDTMTQGDIDAGQVIVIVGFAPLKPAEFVIVRIQQKVGQE